MAIAQDLKDNLEGVIVQDPNDNHQGVIVQDLKCHMVLRSR